MINPLKLARLPDPENFNISTSLTNKEAINEIQTRTKGRFYRPLLTSFIKLSEPKFSGKVTEGGFEVILVRDIVGRHLPIFTPPVITAKITGDKNVNIHVSIDFHILRKIIHKVSSGFSLFWLFCWLFAMPIALTIGIFENTQPVEVATTISNNDAPIQIKNDILFLLYYLAPIILVPIAFIYWPAFLANHSMKRSKDLLLKIYTEASI